jgi:hypothetical protein
LDSQAYAYVLIGIIFLTKYSKYTPICVFGWIFLLVSILLLIAPIYNRAKRLALLLDRWLQGGLYIGSATAIITEGWIGSLNDKNSVLFWILVSWLFLMILVHAFRTGKRVGIYKLVSFGLAGFGILMIISGNHTIIYQVITLVGLLLSIPALDEILDKRL